MPRHANHMERESGVLRALGWSARDLVGFAVCACITIAILINVLFMQSGTHPAPMFKTTAVPAKPVAESTTATVQRSRPLEPAPAASTPPATPAKAAPAKAPAAARTPGDIITDIQRELARRGFFEGTVDGLYGPKTDGAIRDFEHAAGLKPTAEPSEALLQAILRSPARLAKTTGASAPTIRATPVRNEVAAERPGPSKRVVALQRVLAEYGYGQIKPTGFVDAETQAAIEKFERERKLPITGQPSDRVVRELAAVTGRPLE